MRIRPYHLPFSIEKLAVHTKLLLNSHQATINNNTPYYLNVLALKENKNTPNLLEEGTMIAPYSQFNLSLKKPFNSQNKIAILTIVNDYGATEDLNISVD